MKFYRAMRIQDPESGLIPLINVVFLLLIFLMLSGSLSQREAFPVDPPTATSGAPLPAEPLVLLVAADGRLAVAGRQVSEAELLALVEPKTGDALVPVSLKADAGVEAVALVTLLEKLRRSGVGTITLMTGLDSHAAGPGATPLQIQP